MAVTISWSSVIINRGTVTAPEYYKVGIWYDAGVESGVVEIPCDILQNQKITDSSMIAAIEASLIVPDAE